MCSVIVKCTVVFMFEQQSLKTLFPFLICSYDEILVEGLPDWRQPVYYYRRARRMTIYELSFLVLVVATIGQFLIGWAQYFEKWLVLVSHYVRAC